MKQLPKDLVNEMMFNRLLERGFGEVEARRIVREFERRKPCIKK
jgi:hypothetical protein